jgi:hypothetical protein
MSLLKTPVSANFLKGSLIVILMLIVFGFFFPSEEVLFWHMTSSSKGWTCQNFDVTAAKFWIADTGANCATGIHLVRPRPTLFGSLEERGSITFLVQKQITDNSFLEKFEKAFRFVTGKQPDAVLTYTDKYQKSLGKCIVASEQNRNSIVLWCQNPQIQLVTRYRGEETLLPEILEMLKRQ